MGMEQFFKKRYTLARLREGPLGSFIYAYAEQLAERGKGGDWVGGCSAVWEDFGRGLPRAERRCMKSIRKPWPGTCDIATAVGDGRAMTLASLRDSSDFS